MYICVCNAIRECELRRAARQADGGAEEVYAALGARPQCGCCLEDAEELLFEERQMDRELRLVAA
jgi:bacterioferritin-associated ferredoxin